MIGSDPGPALGCGLDGFRSGQALLFQEHEDHVFTGAKPQPAALAGNSPVYGPGWKSPPFVAQGVAGKPGLFLPGRTVYFCPFQPGGAAG